MEVSISEIVFQGLYLEFQICIVLLSLSHSEFQSFWQLWEATWPHLTFLALCSFYISCTLLHFQHTGDAGILGIKKDSGWVSFSAMNSLPFHIKEAESVFSLKTQLKFFFFFFFALQSFSKPLFNQETECILPSESSRYYKKF